jgi:hypothetical protein
MMGSLENVSGKPWVKDNKNGSAYWMVRRGGGVAGALSEMRTMNAANHQLRDQLTSNMAPYDDAMVFDVPAANVQRAMIEAHKWGNLYSIAHANCLDNAFQVLYEYGTFKNRRGVSPQPGFDANTPKDWFAKTRAFAEARGFGTYYWV